MSKFIERVLVAANVLTLLALIFFLARPGGYANALIVKWRAQDDRRDILQRDWQRVSQPAHRLGASTQPIALVEFADYQCPFCKESHQVVQEYLAKHPEVGAGYRHLPLAIHPAARGAARAAICAEEQGRFREMHDELFRNSEWESDTNWVRVARDAGVPDIARFSVCLASSKPDGRLAQDESLAIRLRITGTPTFLTNARWFSGAASDSDLTKLLNR